MKVLIIGQGIAGSCLAWELKRRGADFTIADRPIAETASRVAAGLVNPLTGRAFRPGGGRRSVFPPFPLFTRKRNGNWEVHGGRRLPFSGSWKRRINLRYGRNARRPRSPALTPVPCFRGRSTGRAKDRAAYTRGSGVLHVETMVNAMRRFFSEEGRFVEAEVAPGDIQPGADGFFHWCGDSFSHIVWCTGWEAGMHPDMAPEGQAIQGNDSGSELKDLEWHAGILHFGHWLVHNGFFWRFGATYAWAWDAPGVPEAPAVQELMLDMVKRYSGEMNVIRARAAVRPIIRRSQPVAGPIPGLERQFVFSGLGSKGVTTSPWTAAQLAEHLVHGAVLPPDLLPAALWK